MSTITTLERDAEAADILRGLDDMDEEARQQLWNASSEAIAAVAELVAAATEAHKVANHFSVAGVYLTEDPDNFDALKRLEMALDRMSGIAKARGDA